MKKRILIVAVHPDDETIGCGGTILKHKADGDEVACLFITKGNDDQQLTISKLEQLYQFDKIYNAGLPEIILEQISLIDIIPHISNAIRDWHAEIIYLPNRSDPHSDHRRTFDAAQACIKSFRYPTIRKVLMIEVISETDFAPAFIENVFIPNVFVDISLYMAQKLEILKIFSSELLEEPYTRSIGTMEAYNRYRGSQINCQYAECFMLIKEIL